MGSLIDNVWVFGLAAVLINAVVWWCRGREHMERDPTLVRGYRRLVVGLILLGSPPWVVMGLGLRLGGVGSFHEYFRGRGAHPWVVAYYATVVVVWALYMWWVLIGGGARKLMDHPWLLRRWVSEPRHVKLLACASILGGIIAVAMLLSGILAPP